MENPTCESISPTELGDMRRSLLRILDKVDAQPRSGTRDDLCQRIRRLTEIGLIPEAIADFMHVVRRCRNRAEYEDLIPGGPEACAIRSAWAAIENWHDTTSFCAETSHVVIGRSGCPL